MTACSAEEVLQALQGDTELAQYVGTYHFKTGAQAPALVVLSDNQTIPGLDHIEGVEIVIARAPSTKTTPVLSGPSVIEKTWRLYLVRYEGGDPGDAVDAADRICELCPGASYFTTGDAMSPTAGLEQIALQIPPHAAFPA